MEELGHLPTPIEIDDAARKNGGPTFHVFKRSYPTINEVRKACGLSGEGRGGNIVRHAMPKESILNSLRILCERHPEGINSTTLNLANKQNKGAFPTSSAICKRMGGTFADSMANLGLVNISINARVPLYQFQDLLAEVEV